MHKLYLAAALLALTGAPAFAEDSLRLTPHAVSGEAGIMSDYRVRGISRTDEGPAVQGRLQFQHDLGLYAGGQATNVDLNLDDDAFVETVLYGGYKGQYAGIDYDGKLSWNGYPGGDNDDADYWEFVARGGYDFGPFYASLTWGFSPDYINGSGMGLYYGGDVAVPFYNDFTAKGHLGFQFVDEENRYVSSDTMDWGAALAYNYAPYDVDFAVEYADTDLDDNECLEECGSQFLVRASKDFAW